MFIYSVRASTIKFVAVVVYVLRDLVFCLAYRVSGRYMPPQTV